MPSMNILDKVKTPTGDIAVIVDYSDGHGLCYGVVFPNVNGYYGRKDNFEIHWFEPEQLEPYDGIVEKR